MKVLYRNCRLCPNLCGARRLGESADALSDAISGMVPLQDEGVTAEDASTASGAGIVSPQLRDAVAQERVAAEASGAGMSANRNGSSSFPQCRDDAFRSGFVGICGETAQVRVAWSGLHRGEEPPVSGERGSGMIFFSGCPLHCEFCQNKQISKRSGLGLSLAPGELSRMMLSLQDAGAQTLNLVTGTHFVPSILEALDEAKSCGFSLPVVWNSSGYETVEVLRLIDPYVDLYLLDIKTLDLAVAGRFCGSSRYSEAILPVVRFLKRRHPETSLVDGDLKGVLARHLVFPGSIDSTVNFLHWFADNLKDSFRLSLMTQFVPPSREEISFTPVSRAEYNMLLRLVDSLGIDGFIQEPDGKDALWLPDFSRDNPFPESFADPLPYFLELKHARGVGDFA